MPRAELIIDSFAGGGGASTGIEMALGRSPDVAINHDRFALAMHRANHPDTLHLSNDIWAVDPMTVRPGEPIGLLWASPDCKHFSKAKGGAVRDRNVRDLAWVVVDWAEKRKPRVICLENVEEFRTWGPVGEDGQPIKELAGITFEAWVKRLRAAGYKVDFRELRACDYGAPTIRKRLFMIARRDGKRIAWPKPTHHAIPLRDGRAIVWRKAPGNRIEMVRPETGKQPYLTAAECIDWSLPCPSIFDTAEEILAKHGLRAKRPLAEATLRRIARGVMRYVLDNPRPFIVRTDMAEGASRNGVHPIEEPTRTMTTGGSFAVVAPVVTYAQQGGGNRSADAPMHTLCASPKDQNALIAATMVQTGYGERPGQEPRSLDIEAPIGTQVAGGSKHAVAAAFLAQHNNDSRRIGGVNPGRPADEPMATITASGAQQQIVAASLLKFNGNSTGAALDEPAPTITANSYVKRPGGAAPIGLMAASLANLRGTNATGADIEEPARTVTAGGNHAGIVAAFLTKYYGTGDGAAVDGPMHTDTTRDRMGLVTVEIHGQTFAIVDIGMRMLTPRERFLAQGFPPDYQIETGIDEDGGPVRLTLDQQGRCCGNSVCPPLAAAIVAANCRDLIAETATVAAE